MTFGSFCTKLDRSSLQTLQPETITIKGKLIGFLADLEIIQSVKNTTSKDLDEVIYIFPTDNRLCIYGLTFFIGKEKIEAKISKTNQATEIFNEAKESGYTTIMSEDISPGVTSIKIGNLPKNQNIQVNLTCSLMSQLSSPTTILTKLPLHGCDPKGNYLDLADLPTLSINAELDIEQFSSIQQVNVNCDEYSYDSNKKKLLIQSSMVTSDNLIIEIELSEKVQNQIVKCDKMTVLSVIPEFKSQTKSNQNKEFIFLVDCSASMIGNSIAKAKESLEYFISHVPLNSKFNIIQFGTTYKKFFSEPVEANKKNKEYAKKQISKIKANFGGTQMLELFQELFQSNRLTQREIFIITDGEVFNREEVVKLIEENSYFNRIFAIGLGNGADAGFLDEIAEITNGKSDFVFDSKDLLSKVIEHIELSLVDAAVDTEIHLSGEREAQIVPYPIPPLLPGVLRHFFICDSSKSKGDDDDVLITAKLPNQSDEFEIVVSKEFAKEISISQNQRNPILSLFAQKQLKRIQIENEEIATNLSLESGVLCNFTSYIGVSSIKYVHKEQRTGIFCETYCETCCETYCDDCDYDVDPSASFSCYTKSMHFLHEDRARLRRIDDKTRRIGSSAKSIEDSMCFYREACKTKKSSFFSSLASKFCFWRKNNDEIEDDSNPELSSPPPPQYINHFAEPDDHDVHIDEKEIHSNNSWNEDASITDIVKMQTRDGFWDISTKFIESHFIDNKKTVSVGISFGNPMIDKRVKSTVFVLAFMLKYFSENEKILKNSHQKAIKWLNKINKSTKWDEIISNFKENIQREKITTK